MFYHPMWLRGYNKATVFLLPVCFISRTHRCVVFSVLLVDEMGVLFLVY